MILMLKKELPLAIDLAMDSPQPPSKKKKLKNIATWVLDFLRYIFVKVLNTLFLQYQYYNLLLDRL